MNRIKFKPVFFVLLFFVVVKLFFFTRFMVVLWDESVYMGIGKFLYSAGTVGLFEPIRPLVLPVFLGFGWKLGFDIILFAKFLALFFSISCIYLTYLLARDFFGERVARLSSILLAITPLFFLNSVQVMTEIPSCVFGLLAVLFFVRKKSPWLVGFFCALAFLTRFPVGLLFICLFVSYFFVFKKKNLFFGLSKFIVSFFLTLVPYLIFNFFMYKNIFSPFVSASVHQGNVVHSVFDGSLLSLFHNIFYYVIEPLCDNLLFVFLFFGLFFVFRKKFYRKFGIKLVFVILLFFVSYFTCLVNKQPRFSLVFLPFFAVLSSFGFVELVKWIDKKKRFQRNCFFVVLFLFVVFSSFFVVVKDVNFYGWGVAEEPPIQREFFKFFVDKPTNCILTTDPVPVAYSDRLFIPYYDSILVAGKVYGEFANKCDYTIFTPEPFPCEFFGASCFEKKAELFAKINSSKELVFYGEYYGQPYYIFR